MSSDLSVYTVDGTDVQHKKRAPRARKPSATVLYVCLLKLSLYIMFATYLHAGFMLCAIYSFQYRFPKYTVVVFVYLTIPLSVDTYQIFFSLFFAMRLKISVTYPITVVSVQTEKGGGGGKIECE